MAVLPEPLPNLREALGVKWVKAAVAPRSDIEEQVAVPRDGGDELLHHLTHGQDGLIRHIAPAPC